MCSPATGPANEDVCSLHARFALASILILIPLSSDPTTAATGHRGTCASSRRSCRCPLASAAPLYRVPRAASTSIGCQPTPCLRRLLPERDLGPCCHAADPCPCASSSRPGRVATRPCPRSYRRSCDVILIAAAASLARRPWGLEGATCSGGNSLDSNMKSTTVLAAHSAVRPLAVALAAMSSAFTWMWNSCVCGVGCMHVCVWGMFVCEHNNRHPLAPSIGSSSLLLQQRIDCAQN